MAVAAAKNVGNAGNMRNTGNVRNAGNVRDAGNVGNDGNVRITLSEIVARAGTSLAESLRTRATERLTGSWKREEMSSNQEKILGSLTRRVSQDECCHEPDVVAARDEAPLP